MCCSNQLFHIWTLGLHQELTVFKSNLSWSKRQKGLLIVFVRNFKISVIVAMGDDRSRTRLIYSKHLQCNSGEILGNVRSNRAQTFRKNVKTSKCIASQPAYKSHWRKCLQFVLLLYTHPKIVMVFCSENYSDQLWEKFVPVIEKNFWNSRLSLKAKNLQKFSRSVYSNSDGQSNFFQNTSLTYSWRFLRSNKLWFRNMQ